VCACVSVCERACVRACARVCVHARAYACGPVQLRSWYNARMMYGRVRSRCAPHTHALFNDRVCARTSFWLSVSAPCATSVSTTPMRPFHAAQCSAVHPCCVPMSEVEGARECVECCDSFPWTHTFCDVSARRAPGHLAIYSPHAHKHTCTLAHGCIHARRGSHARTYVCFNTSCRHHNRTTAQ
jgi:hypothetical protein